METSVNRSEISLSKKLLFSLIIVLFFLFLVGLTAEIFLRLTYKSSEYSNKTEHHQQLGWSPKPNLNFNYTIKDKKGNEHNINYSTKKFGFRAFGNPDSEKQKIWFIGDSYTQAIEASDGKCYFDIVGDILDAEVFAFGQAGYGTIQQYVLIDLLLDSIQPDLIVLQTCDNDFIDNEIALERTSNYKVGQARPYFRNGKLKILDINNYKTGFLQNSRFVNLIKQKLKYGISQKITEPAEKKIAELKSEYEPYARSIKNTDLAIKSIKNRIQDIPLVMFSSSTFQPQLDDFKKIALNNNIPFHIKPATEVERLKYSEVLTSSDQYHWIDTGHRLVGETLAPILSKYVKGR